MNHDESKGDYSKGEGTLVRWAELAEVCGISSSLPNHSLPEVAFAGRSNVGKSSLLNTLCQRKSLARTSSQPGKTQTINFYFVNQAVYLVDLPGYGYTNASVQAKAAWGKMVERYLRRSQALRAIFLLVDMRHKPTADDVLMYQWIQENGFSPLIIATKADKVKRSAKKGQISQIRETLNCGNLPVFPFSAVTKEGREEIWDWLKQHVLLAE